MISPGWWTSAAARSTWSAAARGAEWEALQQASHENLATLVPRARFSVVSESGHDIHQDQPELVTEAIRQVVTGVRNPDTWYDLTSCCAT